MIKLDLTTDDCQEISYRLFDAADEAKEHKEYYEYLTALAELFLSAGEVIERVQELDQAHVDVRTTKAAYENRLNAEEREATATKLVPKNQAIIQNWFSQGHLTGCSYGLSHFPIDPPFEVTETGWHTVTLDLDKRTATVEPRRSSH